MKLEELENLCEKNSAYCLYVDKEDLFETIKKLVAVYKAAKIVNKYAIEALSKGIYIYGSEILDESIEELEKYG